MNHLLEYTLKFGFGGVHGGIKEGQKLLVSV